MENILEINDVHKEFANAKALNGVSFSIEKGSVFGLLGPNGAGKTTLLRIINNIFFPDKGEVLIKGEPASLNTSRFLGYMPEERGLYDKMTVEKQIIYFGRLKGGDEKRMRQVMDEYMDIFRMKENARRKVKELSKGNQQKVQIIATLIHEPDIVVLDEPFSGFDPINGALLQDLIDRLRDRGATIILSSHNMNAVEEICESIALLDKGRLLLNGRIDDIKENHRDDKILVTTRNPLNLDFLASSPLVAEVRQAPSQRHRKGYAYELKKGEGVSNADLVTELSIQSEITHFEEKLPSLNDLFLKYTQEAS